MRNLYCGVKVGLKSTCKALRQRVAENVGNAGDSELMSLNATSRIIVSVPADTKIYIVFTKHEESPTGLHRVAGQ